MTANEPFLLHPENGPFVGNETRDLPHLPGVVCLVVPVIVAVIAVPFFWVGHYRWREAQSFEQNRVATLGTVTDRRVRSSLGMVDFEVGVVHSEEEYVVSYRFEVPGPGGRRVFDREASLSESDYNRLQLGARVMVTYDRSDPSVSKIPEEAAPDQHVVLFAIGSATIIMSLLTGLLLAACWWRCRRLAHDGKQLQGRVVSCTARKDDEGGLMFELKYRFVSPSGREITDTATSCRTDLTETTLPTPQTPVVILYLTDTIYKLL